jgi:preprotein translocase subunit SecE
MGSRQRYVAVGVILLAILSAISLSHGLAWVWAQLGWDDMPTITREIPLTSVIGFSAGIVAAAFVLLHKPTLQLAAEVVDELSKVTWPTRQETGSATIIVIITVLACSLFLGLFDTVWMWLTSLILKVPGAAAG